MTTNRISKYFASNRNLAMTTALSFWSNLFQSDPQERAVNDGNIFCPHLMFINSLWPSDASWCCITGSELADVMAWCLEAPNHDLTNIDSWMEFIGLHMKIISQESPNDLIRSIDYSSLLLKLLPHRMQWVKIPLTSNAISKISLNDSKYLHLSSKTSWQFLHQNDAIILAFCIFWLQSKFGCVSKNRMLIHLRLKVDLVWRSILIFVSTYIFQGLLKLSYIVTAVDLG